MSYAVLFCGGVVGERRLRRAKVTSWRKLKIHVTTTSFLHSVQLDDAGLMTIFTDFNTRNRERRQLGRIRKN